MNSLIIDKSKKFNQFFDQKTEVRKIDFLVLHHIEANSIQHAIDQLLEHQVSSHFIIDEAGNIFELVDENSIAYHAGISHWKGFESLNKNSIGIEFINQSPFKKKFEMLQMQAGVSLIKYLIGKYNIQKNNILAHSDIAYHAKNNSNFSTLDRKQDPSELFDWKFLSENDIGIYPKITLEKNADKVLFEMGDKDIEIKLIKEKLAKFGYRILNLNEEFDFEMQNMARVFNRRFNQGKFESSADVWYLSCGLILDELLKMGFGIY